MRDIVHYALPFGIAGDLAGAKLVKRRVEGIFAYRSEVLEKLWGKMDPAGAAVTSANGLLPGLKPA